jgi:hypothetical protein
VLDHTITPEPAKVGPVTVRLGLKDSASHPLTGAHLMLEADMVHPGMAPVFTQAKETMAGNYQGTLDITMPGDWVVLVHGTLADGKKLERQIDMNGVEVK